MKAITVRQPWAELIARGEKLVENRKQVFRHRGPIAIHAGLNYDHGAIRNEHVRQLLPRASRTPLGYGAVIATAQLVDCHVARPRCCDSPWAEQPTGVTPRITHLVLTDVERLPQPVAARGALGLWEWTPP